MKQLRQLIKNYLWVIIVCAIVFFGALYFGKQKTSDAETSQDVSYELSTARIGDIGVEVSGVGQVQASQQVELKAVAAGDAIDVTQVHVENNQRVTKSQLLISLDSREASRRVYDAQLGLESAQISLAKTNDAFDNETAEDKRERQLQEVTVKSRTSSLAQARESLADYQIRAPFDGVITDLSVSTGDSITRTDVIAAVITDENIVSVTLNEVDALSVVEGNVVQLTFDALQGVELTGKVSRVDTIGVAEQGVVGYGVEISIDDSDVTLRPGMSVNAEITADSTEDVLIVPNSAVKGSGQEVYVEQLTDNGVAQIPVSIGTSNTFYTEITKGMSAGDRIITGTSRGQSGDTEEESAGGLFGNLRIPGAGGGRGR